MPIRILLADDHAAARVLAQTLLELQGDFRVVAAVADGREAVDAAARLRPDVAVLDVDMPEMDGIRAAGTIRAISPETAILMFSLHVGAEYVRRALEAGVRGYVVKEAAGADLVPAVRAVAAGQRFFSPAIRALQATLALDLQGFSPAKGSTINND